MSEEDPKPLSAMLVGAHFARFDSLVNELLPQRIDVGHAEIATGLLGVLAVDGQSDCRFVSAEEGGTFRVRVAVGSEGQVTRADPEGANDLSAETIGCIIRRIESASFARPDDSSATLSFSITLEPARRE